MTAESTTKSTTMAMATGTGTVTQVAPRGNALAAQESRGRTEIADRVLERIAAHVLTEVEETGGAARRVLGVPLGPTGQRTKPQVNAHVDGHLAILRMRITVAYPAPIRQVTRRLRDQVTSRVGELTGLEVRQVDIDIARLTRPGDHGRRLL
jgi:uncharacterized alkaline shock family protein YloU